MYLKKIISRWLQYLYFLRFPILAYLFLPLLVYLDGCTGAQKLTRGIVTIDSGWQAFLRSVFVVALGMTTLITARNIVYNGAERSVRIRQLRSTKLSHPPVKRLYG